MNKLIEEYQDIILNVVASALFYISLFLVMEGIYNLCKNNVEFLL